MAVQTAIPSKGSAARLLAEKIGIPLWLGWMLLVVLFAQICLAPFIRSTVIETWGYMGVDFPYFYTAGEKLLRGESPYPEVLEWDARSDETRGWGKYIYPPFFGWLIAPFTVLSMTPARALYITTCAALYFGLLVSWRGKDLAASLNRWLAVGLLLSWGPAIDTLRMAQSNFVPLFLIWGAVQVLRRIPGAPAPARARFEVLAGLMLGAACMVKITPVLILAALVAGGRWRLSSALAAGMGLTFLLTGPAVNWDYFTRVLPTLADFPVRNHFISLNRMAADAVAHLSMAGTLNETWKPLANLAGLAANAALFGFFWGLIFRRRTVLSSSQIILAACPVICLLTASWFHHYTLAVLPYVTVLPFLVQRVTTAPTPSTYRKPLVSLVLLGLLLSPNYFFTWLGRSVNGFAWELWGGSEYALMVPGNLLAWFALLPILLSPEFRQWFEDSRHKPEDSPR
jgi:hypothetical protein